MSLTTIHQSLFDCEIIEVHESRVQIVSFEKRLKLSLLLSSFFILFVSICHFRIELMTIFEATTLLDTSTTKLEKFDSQERYVVS